MISKNVIFINGVLPLVSAFIGTFIGALIGAITITKLQEIKKSYSRKLLKDVLNVISGYKKYNDAQGEFNNRSVVEKKAVAVALKNLGVPIKVNVINGNYNVEKVEFDDFDVNKNLIEKMIEFVNLGLCDDLFFREIGEGFYNATAKTVFARGLANKCLDAMRVLSEYGKIADLIKAAGIDYNQYQVVEVFLKTVDVYDGGELIDSKLDAAKNNVNNGVFDHLFYWDFRAYQNMNSQMSLAENLNRNINPPPQS